MRALLKHITPTRNRKDILVFAVAALLMLGGGGLAAYGISNQQQPATASIATPSTKLHKNTTPHQRFLAFSEPVRLRIPGIGVTSDIVTVGKDDTGAVEVPSGDHYDRAGWYRHSPTPGQPGAAVILGHLDNASTGASVFYELGSLKAGDRIEVLRKDGKTAVFAVTDVKSYARDDFPTKDVYGASGHNAELQLISCGGDFNAETGQYERNIVVFSSLVDDFQRPRKFQLASL